MAINDRSSDLFDLETSIFVIKRVDEVFTKMNFADGHLEGVPPPSVVPLPVHLNPAMLRFSNLLKVLPFHICNKKHPWRSDDLAFLSD